ncbi:ABC transporter ATP-binding protein [Proteiniclasticum ruminis]|uniref:ABC-2 type transport system ATP-binding protein n=1 Tax=Proteiniclasticum ruminis TaxID=398199 RepID=A0A1G8PRL1_9CLOT|nr:ABC transporter ATP-binding protein [Proteiniclasticum ruminis]SDI95117.1 ABC-2 type transport system ATP-binding protein [Proteiniclasticum ruminis]
MNEPMIELKNLTKSFGKKNAIDNLTLTLPKGKIIGLLGPNGSGKSTLFKLLNGLLEPTEGELTIEGTKPSTATKNVISYLPERTYLNEWMKVYEIMDFFADFYEDFQKEKAYSMLEKLSIDPKASLKTLSKGNKEKVQLILVMSRRAKLYLLDEPIGGVDPAARDFILSTILNNYEEGSTLIISTHLISDIEKIFDEVILLKDGQLYDYAPVEDLRERSGKSIDELFREVFRC